jgi:hypothetical protein
MTYLGAGDVWATWGAIQYLTLAPNSQGLVGSEFAWGGGARLPIQRNPHRPASRQTHRMRKSRGCEAAASSASWRLAWPASGPARRY